jgi:hypothetical protein
MNCLNICIDSSICASGMFVQKWEIKHGMVPNMEYCGVPNMKYCSIFRTILDLTSYSDLDCTLFIGRHNNFKFRNFHK